MTDIFTPSDYEQHPMRLVGFTPTGGVEIEPGRGTVTWFMRKNGYTIDVAVNVGRGDNPTLVLVTFDDDKRHPTGFTATGFGAQRILETAAAIADFRSRQDRKTDGRCWWTP